MRLAEYIASSIGKLKLAGIDNPSLDTRLLVGHVLDLDRAQMISQSMLSLSNTDMEHLESALSRRLNHEPVGRIIGAREFWGLKFNLNEATLEPRPDSETVIEAVLKLSRKAHRILDLGTGTGCLLLSLLYEIRQATGLGIDVEPRAVEQATLNAETLNLNHRVEFQVGDWLKDINEAFDVIVSNPPYIPAADIPNLMVEVRDHDPRAALDGGTDGLNAYRSLIPQLIERLNPNGLVAFEVGVGQAGRVADLMRQHKLINVTKHKDLAGIERCVTAFSPFTKTNLT